MAKRAFALKPSRINAESYFSFRNLGFEQREVLRYSSRGTPFTVMEAVGMPRLPPKTLNAVGYLYHDVADAERGDDFGGTAFLVFISSGLPNRGYFYAVTNWHVAVRGGASVLRINTRSGEPDIFPFGPEDWHFDPRYDIAVVHVPLDIGRHVFSAIPVPEAFVTKEHSERVKLSPGEDVFMVGRFIDHDGGPINRPAVRFGNISVMPSPLEQPNGLMADAYCIDLHSRSGYSGSPVWVYRTPGYDLEEIAATELKDAKLLTAGTKYLALLGIHFAQFPEQWEIGKEPPPKTESSVPLIQTGQYVKGLSGMTCVLPAWYILEVLNMPKLKQERDEANARTRAELVSSGQMPPVAESSVRADDDANPHHLEDFTRLVDVAARKKPKN